VVEVTLSERGRAIVERQMESGTYEDAAQVIDRALTLLEDSDERYWSELNRKVEEALAAAAAGRTKRWDAHSLESIRDLARARRAGPS
jgi:putative addiction module CopG family antidote